MPGDNVIHPIYDRWGRLINFDFCSEVEPTETRPYMTWVDPSAQSLKVRDSDDSDWLTIGGGSVVDAEYLVLSLHPQLTEERRFIAGDGLQATDGGAGGDYTLQVDSSVVRTAGAQTIGGIKTFQSNIILDDGVGNSPHIQLVGGSNDDTAEIYLADDAVAGASNLMIYLPGNIGDSSYLRVRNSGGMTLWQVQSNKEHYIWGKLQVERSSYAAVVSRNLFSTQDDVAEVFEGQATYTGGFPIAGFGARFVFNLEDGSGNSEDAATIDAVWDDPTHGSEDSSLRFRVRVGGAALAEMCRIDGTGLVMASGKAITLPDGSWIGLGASAGRLEVDDQTPDELIFSDCNVGIGASPGSGHHLHIEDSTVDTAAGYAGVFVSHTKTAGATDHDDSLMGIQNYVTLNQSGGETGHLIAEYAVATIADGSVGDATNTRNLIGGQFYAQATGGTVTGSAIGFYCPAIINGATISGNVYGFYAYALAYTGSTVDGDIYGGFIVVDDNITGGAGGTVYDLFLYGQTGVNYGIYQLDTADNVFGGHILPASTKTKDLGSSTKRWNTLYQGTSTAAGSSRLVSTKKSCPVCGELMVRGTGSLCVLGEDRDFVLAHCLHCGSVAMEEHQHLPVQALAQRRSPKYIEFVGVYVFEMSGNSRAVRVEFQYEDDQVETFIDPEGMVREMRTPGTTNSTYLSDEEIDALLAMSSDSERKAFLLQMGQREWDALEEIRLMKEQCASLQADLNTAVATLIGQDLVTYQPN